MALTISEQLFESLCAARQVPIARLPTSSLKTADYRIKLRHRSVVAEVKQLDPGPGDAAIAKTWGTPQSPGANAPSDRVQGLLEDAYPQIKRSAAGKLPAIIVVHNNAGEWNWIDSFTVSKAMFGSFGFVVGLDTNHVVRLRGHGYLGRRKTTKDSFRALSAVGVLAKNSFTLYHNPFAQNALPPRLARRLADAQFKHPDPHARGYVSWEPNQL